METAITTEAATAAVTTKTAKIESLIKLGYSRKQVAEMTQSGYGFVQNVFAKFMASEEGKYHRYITLQKEIAERQEELKSIGEEIIDTAHGKQIVHQEDGLTYEFQVKNRRTFTYSEAVKLAESRLKIAKQGEETDGTATARFTPYISVIK